MSKKALRAALNEALDPNTKGSRWNMATLTFFRLLRAEGVTKDRVVFGVRSPKTIGDLKTFDKVASKKNTIQMHNSGSDAE